MKGTNVDSSGGSILQVFRSTGVIARDHLATAIVANFSKTASVALQLAVARRNDWNTSVAHTAQYLREVGYSITSIATAVAQTCSLVSLILGLVSEDRSDAATLTFLAQRLKSRGVSVSDALKVFHDALTIHSSEVCVPITTAYGETPETAEALGIALREQRQKTTATVVACLSQLDEGAPQPSYHH